MRLALLLCISIAAFFNSTSYSKCSDKPITIGILDTGFGYQNHGLDAKLCKYGHKNFSTDNEYTRTTHSNQNIPLDSVGHGTNIAGIIAKYADEAHINYCLVILKWYSRGTEDRQHIIDATRAMNYAADIKLDYINYSAGGSLGSAEEYNAIERYLNGGGHYLVAAGNEGWDLDSRWISYYPAKYALKDKRIIVAGMLGRFGVKSYISNYGSIVTSWEVGQYVEGFGIVESGTSQATAVTTGKLVSHSNNRCEKNVNFRH